MADYFGTPILDYTDPDNPVVVLMASVHDDDGNNAFVYVEIDPEDLP